MGNFSTFWDRTGIGVPRPKPAPLPSLVLLEVLGIPLEAKLYGKSYASLWYDLFGKRRMQEFFSIKRDLKGRCGFNFTFIHLCGPASCTDAFRGVPLPGLHLNWVAVCDSSL